MFHAAAYGEQKLWFCRMLGQKRPWSGSSRTWRNADFNDPLPDPSSAPPPASASAAGAASAAANPESVAMLTSMGFSDTQAAAALQARDRAVLHMIHGWRLHEMD